MTALTGAAGAARPEYPQQDARWNGWQLFAPIPDRVGFGGMFAGVLGGQLVAGGGSQFPERPLWLKGDKAYTDRIFTLAAPHATWAVSATRLPVPIASAAVGNGADVIYLAGGLNATGCLRQVWSMRPQGSGFVFSALPDLPTGVGYASGAVVGRRFYVIGGLPTPASKEPSTAAWSLDFDATSAGWRREPDLPPPGLFVTATATDGTALFVLGGVGFDAAGKAVPAKTVYRLMPGDTQWRRQADLPEPRVGISSPCPQIAPHRFFLIGGYADVFPGAPREHPGFSAQTYYFDSAAQRYDLGPRLPHAPVVDRDSPGDSGPAPMIGAPAVVWRDHIVVIGGEVRSSVRTPAVLAWPLHAAATGTTR